MPNDLFKRLPISLAVLQALAMWSNAYALPTGEAIQAGQATFQRNGDTLRIDQSSAKAIVNWQSFNIGRNEAVNLFQPNHGAALFRILGPEASQIFGSLSATGSLFLSNPNGILFAPWSRVDVGSLVATTMRINNADFMSGNYQFFADPDHPDSSVINQGVIRTTDGGYLVLLGNKVENSGSLQANNGSVVLGSAESAVLDFYGDGLVKVNLSGDALNAAIEQTGNITANGGAVQLAANARTAALNVDGVIQANSLVERNGVIRLEGGVHSTVLVSGRLDASRKDSGTKGGNITVTGERVALLDGATVDVSGSTGGGTALIGGDYQGKNVGIQNAERTYVASGASINADALDSGDGGKVVVWADDITRYYGNISAKGGANAGDGGFVEVSGKNYLDFNGLVSTSASYGDAGTLLLDPTNITISTGINSIESSGATIFQEASSATSILNTTTLQNALASNNVEVTTASPAASAGTITVANAVAWASGNSLTLTANSTIAINAAITTGTAASALILNATGNVTQSATGIIGGSGGLTKNGAGTLTLSRANTYTGTTAINAGTLTMGASNVFADASSILVNGGTLNANTRTDTVAGVRLDSGSITGTTGALTSTTAFDLRDGTVSKILGGAVGLNKTTAGTVTLSGTNTYTGATNINEGTLIATNNAALGSAAGGTTVANGATLAMQGNRTITEALTITGDGVGGTAGALRNISGNSSYSGAITLGTGGARINSDAGTLTVSSGSITSAETLTVGGAGNTTVSKVIATGAGTLTKDGTGTLTLSGANTYDGATNINAGTLIANNNAALGSTVGGTTVADGATLAIQGTRTIGDALTITGSGVGGTAGALRNNSQNNTYTGAITLGVGGALIHSNANTLTLSGAGNITGNEALTIGGVGATTISKIIDTGAGTLTKNGTGTLTLSGANTYTGATVVNAGTTAATTSTNALGAIGAASGTTVNSGATLAYGSSLTFAAESLTLNGGTLSRSAGNPTMNGAIDLAANSTVTGTSGTFTLGGVISGAGNLTKTGAGTVVLSGNNTYAGLTNVNAGILQINNANGLGGIGSGTTVNAGTLAYNGTRVFAAEPITLNGGTLSRVGGNPTMNGTIDLAANSTITGAGGTFNLGGATSGAGNLTKTGAGTVVLSGNNTYTGATNINAGILRVAGGNGIGDSSAVTMANIASARLDLNGSNETIGSLAGGGAAGGNVTLGAAALTTGDDDTSTTYSGVISGSGGITKIGTGTMTLSGSGANTYTGTTNINEGTLVAAKAAALGTVAGGTTVANGATLNINNVAIGAEAVSLSGTLTGTDTASLAGNVTLGGAGAIGTTSLASSLGLTGAVNAPFALDITGAGNVTATNINNNFTTVAINGANNVTLRDVDAIEFGASTVNGALSVTSNGAITQTGALNVVGATTLAPGLTNDITLTNAANDFSSLWVSGRNITVIDIDDLTIGTSSVNRLSAQTLSGDLTLGGNIVATGADDAIVLASAANFVNSGNNTLSLGSGRWLVYSADPANDVRGAALTTAYVFKQYNTTYPGTILGAGNGFIYSVAPTITATLNGTAAKVYDGTTTAAIVGLSLGNTGVIDGDIVNLTGLLSANYDTEHVGINKTITANGISISGATNGVKQVYGYQLDSTSASNNLGTVTQASLNLNAVTDTKVYDGTTASTGVVATPGLVGDDSIDDLTQSFGSKNVLGVNGSTLAVDAGYTVNDGNGGGNYAITENTTTGTINKKDITAVTGITAADKTYDGNLTAILDTSTVGFTGIIGSELLAVATATGTFNDKDVVDATTVSITGISLGNGVVPTDLASNYNLTSTTATDAAIITPRGISITADAGQTKVYGSVDPIFTFTVGGLGIATGDALSGNLNRAAGETVGAYAMNQGSLAVPDPSNYIVAYIGNNFNVLQPASTTGLPNTSAGLVDLNPKLGTYTGSQLFILSVAPSAAGGDGTSADANLPQCESNPDKLAKDKDFSIMINYGLNLPKGLNNTCI